MPTASSPLNSAAERGSSVPSLHVGDVAEPDRCGRCARRRRAARSRRACRDGRCRRIVRSSSAPFRRPTGAARFCACSACTTCADADAGRLQRLRAELDGHLALDAADDVDLGDAGDAAQLARDAGIGEARQLARPISVCDDSASDTIGRSCRIEPREDRLLHLRRQVVADLRDRVADVLRRLLQVLLEQELDDDRRRSCRASSTAPCRRR